MAVPKSVKVGAITVRVVKVKEKAEREDIQGEYKSDDGAIELDANLAPSVERMIFTHELGHAVWQLVGLHETTKTMKHDELEEGVIYPFSSAWLGMLRDNPAVVRYLTEK